MSDRDSRGRFKVVNRGEEKVRVHINVVPRSTFSVRGRFKVVNRGEEKVRVHINVVPRSTFSVRPRSL